jgi:hypothetical protein
MSYRLLLQSLCNRISQVCFVIKLSALLLVLIILIMDFFTFDLRPSSSSRLRVRTPPKTKKRQAIRKRIRALLYKQDIEGLGES